MIRVRSPTSRRRTVFVVPRSRVGPVLQQDARGGVVAVKGGGMERRVTAGAIHSRFPIVIHVDER